MQRWLPGRPSIANGRPSESNDDQNDPENIYTRRPRRGCDANRQSERDPVKEIFEIFDADRDGKLSKAEYKSYLKGIGS